MTSNVTRPTVAAASYSWGMVPLLGNLAYGLMAFAFITRDLLYLRSLLVIAQTLVIAYALLAGVPVIAAWNVLYVSVNAYMAVQLLQERRAVRLPDELQALYERHFAALAPGEFLRWWAQGEPARLEANAALARDGDRPSHLYFRREGRVQVRRGAATLAELPGGYFIGEMSLLTNRAANADAIAITPLDVHRWERDGLEAIRDRNPTLWTRIQAVIGHDLVEKIHLAEQAGSREPTGGA
jgi:CRP-like cAMP-binding protein